MTAQRAGFATGFLAAATSPFNLAWWLGAGSALLAAQGPGLAVGMFAGILGWLAFFNGGLAWLGRRAERVQRGVAYASAAILLGFAVWIAARGVALLAPGWLPLA